MMEKGQAKEYYGIITAIWKQFHKDIAIVDSISDPQDKRWEEIVARYEDIEKSAPASVQDYANSMILMHIAELEKRWRFKR